MFRMEFVELGPELTVRIEGRFVGHFAEEARLLIARQKLPMGLKVDVSDLTYLDLQGEEALTWLAHIGARFIADTSYSLDVCERLGLRLAKHHGGHRALSSELPENGIEKGP